MKDAAGEGDELGCEMEQLLPVHIRARQANYCWSIHRGTIQMPARSAVASKHRLQQPQLSPSHQLP
jgi:hypothetical protein